jgi:uncharacterized protein
MIINIGKTHPIFSSDAYQKDVVPFNLMEVIKQSPQLLISDEKNFIAGMSAPQFPVWIWTVDRIPEEALSELCDYYYNQFSSGESSHFVAKPAIASRLSKRFIDEKNAVVNYKNRESYECPKLISAKNSAVIPVKPGEGDIEEIADCIQEFTMDCLGREQKQEDCLKDAQSFIDREKSFVIKQGNTVAAIACSARKTDRHVAINHVYTRPAYRCKGFAAVLVAHISELILNGGKIPLLYTDLSNPASNKAYKNIGFVERGKVDEIILSFK